MSPLISIGNPNPYINRRPSSHTGYCITISGMLVHRTLVARNSWGSAINQQTINAVQSTRFVFIVPGISLGKHTVSETVLRHT